ncbi:DUF1999 domain-containing protein [Deinococcus sp.]|uniref:DUF1999 domain-containing protein n=1 Tax=Deinococcus sp. TaxID=47478 RepID=UPI0025BEAA31|nr:DUF1999 domain-containing protein [Deinococcus sp.]
MRYRTFTDADYAALQALDRQIQLQLDPAFGALPEREQEGRLHTSLAALKFYERSEHSFVAEDGEIQGFIFAQSVWQGDRPVVLVRTLSALEGAPTEMLRGLVHAAVKSAYDCAVYEVHLNVPPALRPVAEAEEAHRLGDYAVIHLGTRASTAPGELFYLPILSEALAHNDGHDC